MTTPTTTTTAPQSDAKLPTSKPATKAAKPTTKATRTEQQRNRHRFLGMQRADRSPTVTDIGGGVVEVEAFGRLAMGERATFLIDTSEWSRISTAYGDTWMVIPNGPGGFYIGSSRKRATANVDQPKGAPAVAALARLIVDAPKGCVVTYRNGNYADLRRENLATLTKAEAAARWAALRHARAQMKAVADHPDLFAGMMSKLAAE